MKITLPLKKNKTNEARKSTVKQKTGGSEKETNINKKQTLKFKNQQTE